MYIFFFKRRQFLFNKFGSFIKLHYLQFRNGYFFIQRIMFYSEFMFKFTSFLKYKFFFFCKTYIFPEKPFFCICKLFITGYFKFFVEHLLCHLFFLLFV